MIVADLSDEQMVQYMGRENGEDYNALLIMLQHLGSWGFYFVCERTNPKVIDVARLFRMDEASSAA